MEVPIRWDEQGVPYSEVFNDKYFCTEHGLEESFYVSCQGNRLQERFLSLDPKSSGTFTIIETGFGTGLSFCTAWKLWQESAPRSWKMHFISIELYPLSLEQLSKALSVWPLLKAQGDVLIQRYAPLSEGITQAIFEDQRIELTLVVEDVVKALNTIKCKGLAPHGADAWFLNGFSPFKNPQMWSPEVFAGMAPLSRAGTTLATFTVAGFVRRGLEANGFKVERIKGHGKKKNILVGQYQKEVF